MKKINKRKLAIYELSRTPNVSYVCKKIGISRSTLYRWMDENDHYKDQVRGALESGETFINDMAENNLFKKISEGDWKATAFRLEKRHKKYNSTFYPNILPNSRTDRDVLLDLEELDLDLNNDYDEWRDDD